MLFADPPQRQFVCFGCDRAADDLRVRVAGMTMVELLGESTIWYYACSYWTVKT